MHRFVVSGITTWLLATSLLFAQEAPRFGVQSSTEGQETRRVYLSGRGKDDAVPWRFMVTAGEKAGDWTRIPVPSCWEAFGFGTASYQKESTNAIHEKGHYQVDFEMQSKYRGRRVFLVFEGVMTDAHVEVNGKPAGPDHQGAFYRFQYEITDKIKYHEPNRLDVVVSKRSANDSVNRAERQGDYWLFGGIFRPVYLEIVPPAFIERTVIDARADGSFNLDVHINGLSHAATNVSVDARIYDLKDQPFGWGWSRGLSSSVTSSVVTLNRRFDSPLTWSAETPNLYKVELRIRDRYRVYHQVTERFGFRTVEVRDGDGIYVNGRRVILRGANRHSFWPFSGRTLSEQVHRLDIKTMKEMNMNAVRMSHYPPDKRFLELCDELGLYVLDELAGWHWSYDTPTATRLVEQMVKRDVNHPCILFWDNGNEGGWNTAVDEEFARWDPQGRRVLHPWNTFNGVNTAHYLSYEKTKAAVAGEPNYRNFDYSEAQVKTNSDQKYIYMPTEFLHGLYDGGAGAGFEDYWNLMRASPYLGGGFIWALVDEGFRWKNRIDVFGNQGPDGLVGPFREREASFYTVKELWSPISVTRISDDPADEPRFRVENHYSFINAGACSFEWELCQFKSASDRGGGHTVLEQGQVQGFSLPPGAKGEFSLKLPESYRQADALSLTVRDPDGMELWTWVYPLKAASRPGLRQPAQVAVVDQPETIQLVAGDLKISIDKKTGFLREAQRGNQVFSLARGPRPAQGTARLKELKADPANAHVRAEFDGELKEVVWKLNNNGWLECAYAYTAEGELPYHGVLFDYPEASVKSKRWLGEGPYRVWKNRLRGTRLGVWENEYNNTITGWRDWTYPEFKGCFAGVRWMQWETAEGDITFRPSDSSIYVQVLTPELPPKELQMKTEIRLPETGLGLLHAIPPIGSKFSTAREHGPQGAPNVAEGLYRGSVGFFFGAFN